MARPVIFDEAAAQRIVATIRKVETGDRREKPLDFSPIEDNRRRVFRIGTFVGAWGIGDTKTVTLKYKTSTPNTATAINLFYDHPGGEGPVDCAIGKEGTAWHVLSVPFRREEIVVIQKLEKEDLDVVMDVTVTFDAENCGIETELEKVSIANYTITTGVTAVLQFDLRPSVLPPDPGPGPGPGPGPSPGPGSGLSGEPVRTIYFNAAADGNWGNPANWWNDTGFSEQATNLPRAGDTVILRASVTTAAL
jgi:hypothetical protein